MIKRLSLSILLFSLSILSPQAAQAGIKFDFSGTANKVVDTVSGWAEDAQKWVEESTTIQTMIAYGKGAIETAKMLKEQADSIKSSIDQTTSAVNSAKNAVTSAAGEITSEVTSLGDDALGAAGGVAGNAAGGAISAASSAAGKTQSAQQLLSLKNEKTSLESEYNAAAETRKAEYEGKVKSYQDNNATYQQMIAQDPSQKEALEEKIIANNEAIRQLQTEYEANEQKEKAAYDERVAAIDKQIQEVQAAAAEESMSLAADAYGIANSMFGNQSSAAELNATISNNFVPEKEALTSQAINRVKTYRSQTQASDVIQAYAVALQARANREKDNEDADQKASNVPQMEASSAAIAMDTQLKVKNMKSLLIYTQILIEDMKLRTASDLANLNVYKLNNPSKDVTQFNLDDYKYKKPSFFSKDNLSNLASKAKSGLSAAKSGLSTAQDGLSAAKSAAGEASSFIKEQTETESSGSINTEVINQLPADEQETTQISSQTNFPYNLTLGEVETLESLKGTDVTETLVIMNMNGVSKEDALRIIQSGATQDDVEMLKKSGIDTSYVDQIAKGEMVNVVNHAQGLMEEKQRQEQRIQELEQQRSSVLEKLKQE